MQCTSLRHGHSADEVASYQRTGLTMAKRKARASARKSAPARRPAAKRARSTKPKHVPTKGLYGWITHTDLASNNPAATKDWAAKVLGWTFKPPFKTPNGDIHLFAYSEQGGGGIRPL